MALNISYGWGSLQVDVDDFGFFPDIHDFMDTFDSEMVELVEALLPEATGLLGLSTGDSDPAESGGVGVLRS